MYWYYGSSAVKMFKNNMTNFSLSCNKVKFYKYFFICLGFTFSYLLSEIKNTHPEIFKNLEELIESLKSQKSISQE